MEFKIGDIVRWNVFPHENDTFKIVGSKIQPWIKVTPYKIGGIEIKVQDDKDFILLRKMGDNYGDGGNGVQVSKEEIEIIKSP